MGKSMISCRIIIHAMSIKYIKLPIYSVAVFGQFIYFSGGGGGSTGIPNEIKIYHQRITPEPANSIETSHFIIQNLTVCESKGLLICNANQFIVVYRIGESGKVLQELYRFQADFSPKHPNVNALCVTPNGATVMAGCEDMVVRFYHLGDEAAELLHQHNAHAYQIKCVDHNQKDLYVSTDNRLIVVSNLQKKQIVRTVHNDQLLPEKTLFRSAYFVSKDSQELVIVHFTPRTTTFVTKQERGKYKTKEIANDQCSQTAYHHQNQLLGVACANGLTTLINSRSLSQLGSQNGLKSGVNACVITKRRNLISGTSNCSYHIQGTGSGDFLLSNYPSLPALLLTILFIYLMGADINFEL